MPKRSSGDGVHRQHGGGGWTSDCAGEELYRIHVQRGRGAAGTVRGRASAEPQRVQGPACAQSVQGVCESSFTVMEVKDGELLSLLEAIQKCVCLDH